MVHTRIREELGLTEQAASGIGDAHTLLLEKQECVCVTYSRRSLLKETQLFPDSGVDHWTLDWDPGCTTEQRQLRDRWFEIV